MLERLIGNISPNNLLYLNLIHLKFRLLNKGQYEKSQKLKRKMISGNFSYSLSPFIETETIFVHIPKCAGVSISQHLYSCLAGGHYSLDTYTKIFRPCEYSRYFKYTFVRNPWDRLVSAFHYLKEGGMDEKDRKWAADNLGNIVDFEDFVVNWLTVERAWSKRHLVPQHHYVITRFPTLKLDYIGFIENIDNDFSFVANKLGRENSLAKKNQSRRQDYRSYYSRKMRDKVADIYSRDIELFEYDFDNQELENQIYKRERRNLNYFK
ncbi:sulfotransferase family 2 domain-containing protein [Mesorhizobium sp. ZMM04-5]|uniref:Sulfotransferase family 2 domain-containing protein n=1 Tax=Mesorhizobium marinum TaxID=3228790 RepID=A0ABV3R6S4_9HYPH